MFNMKYPETVLSAVYHPFGNCVQQDHKHQIVSSAIQPLQEAYPGHGCFLLWGKESQTNANVARENESGRRDRQTEWQRDRGKLFALYISFKRVQPKYIKSGNSKAVIFKSPSRINIENLENFIWFFQEVPITEPELLKRNLEWLRNFDIKVTWNTSKWPVTAPETKAVWEARGKSSF